MPLQVQTPAQYVAAMQSGITALTTRVKNFSTGSVLGALTNAVTTQLLFLQQQAQFIVSITRSSTSAGADLTSFVTDYFLNPVRIPAVSPQGQVTFTKVQAPTVQQVILVGTIVQTKPQPPALPVQYAVIADTSNASYNAGLNGYILAANTNSVSVTVQGTASPTQTGTQLNVLAGTLSSIATSGIPADTVTNPLDITNGVDAESDNALRIRFQKYISSLATANANAIASAVLSTLPGATYTVNDSLDANGATKTAFFTVVVDDGSGAIPAASRTSVLTAVNLERAAGISCTVVAPTNIPITVVVNGTVIQSGFNGTTVRSAIQAALIAYVNANGVGGANVNNAYVPSLALLFAGVASVVAGFIGIGANQGLSSFSSITVNGGTTNVALTTYQLARTSSGSVSVL